ncbi:hypothetical protein BKA69DRAFT_1166290 [Paraphysoderma sedebokerense]|nr:hypothetical protein BKA69DRAFT_1166290 [Paraphysoderma sedebokerense]
MKTVFTDIEKELDLKNYAIAALLWNFYIFTTWLIFIGINWMFSYNFRAVILLNEFYANKLATFQNSNSANIEKLLGTLKLNRAEKFIFKLQKKLLNADKRMQRSPSESELRQGLVEKAGLTQSFNVAVVLKAVAWTSLFGVFLFLLTMGYTYQFGPASLDPNFKSNGIDYIPVFLFSVLHVMSIPYFLYLIRSVSDSLYIKLEQTVTLAAYIPGFIMWLLTYFVPFFERLFWVGPNIWLLLVLFVAHTALFTIPGIYALLKGNKKPIDNSVESFQRVLNDKELFQRLKKVLAQDFCVENALFYEEYMALFPNATASRISHAISTPEAARRHVQYIVKTFIVNGALHELNLTSATKKAVLAEAQKGNYSVEILERAKNEVVQLMYLNSYQRLLKQETSDQPRSQTSAV